MSRPGLRVVGEAVVDSIRSPWIGTGPDVTALVALAAIAVLGLCWRCSGSAGSRPRLPRSVGN